MIYSSTPSRIGQKISQGDLSGTLELEVNGHPAGWLLLPAASRKQPTNPAEVLFLRNVTSSSLISGGGNAVGDPLGGVLAFTLTRGLRELTAATQEISQGRLGAQVKVRSKDELGELAASFNQMSIDLAAATQARRQMTADIAHDLRTPLSVLSGYAEALADSKLAGSPEVYNVLHQESLRLNRLVEDLRTLSLADAGELSLYKQAVAPERMLEWAAARHAVAAQDKTLTLRLEPPAALPAVQVDAERMAQVLDNLIVNAFRFTPPGGEVGLAASTTAGGVNLTVRDTGSGIAPGDLPHIFDRFYRADPRAARAANRAWGWPSPAPSSKPTAARSASPHSLDRAALSRSPCHLGKTSPPVIFQAWKILNPPAPAGLSPHRSPITINLSYYSINSPPPPPPASRLSNPASPSPSP